MATPTPPSSSLSTNLTNSTNTNETKEDSKNIINSTNSTNNDKFSKIEENPSTLEHKHVTEVYDLIALHFSSTRYKAWPRVENFLNSLPKGAVVADVGCGNGKYLGVNPNVFAIGSDRTGKFAEICAEKGFESMICDNLQLPYRNSCFDSVISIAVVHHFASPERRLQAIKELVRILRCGGRMLFTVWAVQQDWKQKQYGEQDVMIPWHFRDEFKKGQEKKEKEKKIRPGRIRKKEERREKFKEKTEEENKHAKEKREMRKQKGKEEEDVALVLGESLHIDSPKNDKNTNEDKNEKPDDNSNNATTVPTENTTENNISTKTKEATKETTVSKEQPAGEVYHRYYHLFKEGEIEGLFEQVPSVKLVEVVLDHDNWYVIAEKTN